MNILDPMHWVQKYLILISTDLPDVVRFMSHKKQLSWVDCFCQSNEINRVYERFYKIGFVIRKRNSICVSGVIVDL